MEGIKETDLNLQREVVTTLANTWLVEAVNPSTGVKKMINIANYASVVAGQIGIKKGSIELNSAGDYTIPVTYGLIHMRWSSTRTSFIVAVASKNEMIEIANGYPEVYGVGTTEKVINLSKDSDSSAIKVSYNSTSVATLEWVALTE